LTSHRVCYVAAEEPRKFSVGIDLKEVDRAEYQVELAVYSSFAVLANKFNPTLGRLFQVIA
jgi:ESCRT-II complex subunit VPS36